MCLYIDKTKHPNGKPLIAGYDMLVWKWMLRDSEGNITSFYRDEVWQIGVEKTAVIGPDEDYPTAIGPGLHAHTRPVAFDPKVGDLFGIIPSGAEFYLGEPNNAGECEIVANRMTVYRTLEDALQGRTLGPANVELHKLVTA